MDDETKVRVFEAIEATPKPRTLSKIAAQAELDPLKTELLLERLAEEEPGWIYATVDESPGVQEQIWVPLIHSAEAVEDIKRGQGR